MGGPVEFDSDRSWRGWVQQMLEDAGITVFRPDLATKFMGGVNAGAFVQAVCLNTISICDHVLVYLPDGVLTIGTPIEMFYAKSGNAKVAVVCSKESAFTAGFDIYQNLDDAVVDIIGRATVAENQG